MGNLGDKVPGYRLEIQTGDTWVTIPNATLTMDFADEAPSEYDSPYKLSATCKTFTFSAQPVSQEAYALITGQKAPSDTPIYSALVEERIEYWKGVQ